MGNVLRAIRKSGDRSESPGEPAVRIVTLAVAAAQKAAEEALQPDPPADSPARETAPAEPVVDVVLPAENLLDEANQAGPELAREIPADATMQISPLIIAHHKPHCRSSEQIRQVRVALLNLVGQGPMRCLITSARAEEGKTLLAANLAYSLSEIAHKRTLLIDADLRHGSIAELFGLENCQGLREVLSGHCRPNRAIRPTLRHNLDVVVAGADEGGSVGDLLGGNLADVAIAELVKNYDHVIVDSPAIEGQADAAILGRWASHGLLAIRMEATPRESAEAAVNTMRNAGVNMAGMIAWDQVA